MKFEYEDDELNYFGNYNYSEQINEISPFKAYEKSNKKKIYYNNNMFSIDNTKINFIRKNKNNYPEINFRNSTNSKINNNYAKNGRHSSNSKNNFYNNNLFRDTNNDAGIFKNINNPKYNHKKYKDYRYMPQTKYTNDNYFKRNLSNSNLKNHDFLFNENINVNGGKFNNISNLNYTNNNQIFNPMRKKRPNNRYQQNLNQNDILMSENIYSFNNFPLNNSNIRSRQNNYKNINFRNNDILTNQISNNFNKIDLNINQIKRNKFIGNNNKMNRKKRIIELKEDLKNESESLSQIAEILYNYHLKQKNEKKLQNKNEFSDDKINNINIIDLNKDGEKDFINNNIINVHFNKKRENIIKNDFQLEIKEENRNNNYIDYTSINKRKNYYPSPQIKEKIDFRSDIETKEFNSLQFKAFKGRKNSLFQEYDEKEESKEHIINLLNNKKRDNINLLNEDNIFFENTYKSPLRKSKKRIIIKSDKNENEIINNEDSICNYKNYDYSENNKIYNADNEQDEDDKVLGNDYEDFEIENNNINGREEQFNFNFNNNFNFSKDDDDINFLKERKDSKDNLENSDNEDIKENENNESNENFQDQLINSGLNIEEDAQLMNDNNDNSDDNNNNNFNNRNKSGIFHYILLRHFGFDILEYERNQVNQENQLDDSSFYSFNQNNHTINGSTEFSINDQNSNSASNQSANPSVNESFNSNGQKVSQELLICSGENINKEN